MSVRPTLLSTMNVASLRSEHVTVATATAVLMTVMLRALFR